MIRNRMKRWLHIITALSLIWQQISPAYATMQTQESVDEAKTRSTVPVNTSANQLLDPFKSALSAFKSLRATHSQLQSLKENEPACFISYARGVPEHEKLMRALGENLKEAGINFLPNPDARIRDNENGTTTYHIVGSALDAPINFVIVAGSKTLMKKYESKAFSAVNLELEMLAQGTPGFNPTILPILLEGIHKEVLPKFLWNTVSISFHTPDQYPLNCFSLLSRLYQLDSQDAALQAIIKGYKDQQGLAEKKPEPTSVPSLLIEPRLDLFKQTLSAFRGLRATHPKLKALGAHHPTAFLSYSWGSPRNEKIVHLLAEHLRDAGINVMLDIWHNSGGTGITQFAEKILDAQTDFVVLNGTKKLIEKYNSQAYSVVKMELGMIAQRATGASQTIIPLVLEGDYKNVLPKFVWNNARLDFRNLDTYHLNLFMLLGRLYQLDSHDASLQGLVTDFKKKKEQGERVESIAEVINALPLAFDPQIEKYIKAAKQGDITAQFDLAARYDEGQGVEQNAKKATKWYLEAAQQGHAQAQFNLGLRYDTGHGADKDEKEAFKWYKASADQDNAAAQCNLGAMYEQGRGINKDDIEAVKYYRLAATRGHAPAKNNLGRIYEEGRGIDKNEKEAARLYREAADQNHIDAQNNLGRMYEEGRGIDKNESEAISWYTRAAEQGHRLAQENLKRIAEQGNAMAQCNIGDMYEHGRGVGQDDREAVKWYLRAAKQNSAEAQAKLGVVLQTLTELNLEASNLGNEGAKVLAKALEGNDAIMSFDLRDNDISEEGALSLIQSFKGRREIKVKGLGKLENLLDCMQNQTSKLDLSAAGLTDKEVEVLASLLGSLSHLQRLNLSSNSIGEKGILALIQSLNERKGLKVEGLGKFNNLLECFHSQATSLDLSSAGLTHKGAEIFASFLPSLPYLQQLNLSSNSIGAEGAKALGEGLKSNSYLTTLGLGYNSIGDEGAKALGEGLKSNTSLTSLNLERNSIGAEGAKALGEGLKSNASLKELNLDGNGIGNEGAKAIGEGLKGNASLTALKLGVNGIGNEGAKAIGEGIKGNASLKELKLESNNILAEGAKAIGEGLKGNASLATLNLYNNIIGAEGVLSLIQVLKDKKGLEIKGFNKFENILDCMRNQTPSLDLSRADLADKGAEILASLLFFLPHLQQLDLSENSIGAEGAKALGKDLKGYTSLTTLNLERNSIGAEGAKAIVEGLKANTSLKELNLYSNSLGNEGAKAIGKGLKGNASLTTLNLERNSIGAEGAKSLGEGLKGNASLKELNLDGNSIGNEGAKAIEKGLKGNTSLIMLNLWGNSIEVERREALERLKKKRPMLKIYF